MEVLPHVHPLKLIDLNPEYPHDEVVYDDEEELIMKQDFRSPCGHCGQEINFYYRYYYTCDQCDYSLHRLCGKLPTTLEHEFHRDHSLILCQVLEKKWCLCQVCKREHVYQYVYYRCAQCDISIGLQCTKHDIQNHMIYHPSHQHPLTPIYKYIEANCDACGNTHTGNFYHCITCFCFFANGYCLFLRKKLLIQNFRKDNFFHTHMLTLAYSFSKDDQKAKFDPKCKVCELQFDENLWIYKCEKCRYYVHTDCATTSKKASVSALLNQGASAVLKNYKDSDHPIILHLPFPDQASQKTGVLKYLFWGEKGSRAFETNLTHPFHRHPLTLVNTPTPTSTIISTSSIHDSMKMVEDLCDACVRPVTNMPFYKCTSFDKGCNFVLHVWCTRLPTVVGKTLLYGEMYPFKLLPQESDVNLVLYFQCIYCGLDCNGFVYRGSRYNFDVDVSCALTPEHITHKSHPNHLLKWIDNSQTWGKCRLCLSDDHAKKQLFYGCKPCKFNIHCQCALLFAETIRHKYDKHPMTLRYFPVESYNGDYFCEVCEEEFNPNAAFYHCDQCVQSMHPACCVSIQKETTPFYLDRGVAQIGNVKLGIIFMSKDHPHPVSLFRGVESDGECTKCGDHLQDGFILKCLQCKFAIDRKCARRYDYSREPVV